ncbi:MAG: DUF4136 domain-containing protein [Bacteroidales bacterium]|nr:DUF4136 domain-containing protein [Bacteroidales bacterium]
MKAIKYFSLVFISVIFMMGCASVKVVTDTKSDVDFSNYQTFKVVHYVNEEDQKAQKFSVNQMNRSRIESAIASNAELRGMKKVESNPDVVLLWATDVDIEKSYSSHTTYAGGTYMGYRGRYYMGGGPVYTTTDVNQYYLGKLTVAVVEHGSEDMLWYGQGQKDISGDANKAEETINLIVSKIMEQFPIGSVPE